MLSFLKSLRIIIIINALYFVQRIESKPQQLESKFYIKAHVWCRIERNVFCERKMSLYTLNYWLQYLSRSEKIYFLCKGSKVKRVCVKAMCTGFSYQNRCSFCYCWSIQMPHFLNVSKRAETCTEKYRVLKKKTNLMRLLNILIFKTLRFNSHAFIGVQLVSKRCLSQEVMYGRVGNGTQSGSPPMLTCLSVARPSTSTSVHCWRAKALQRFEEIKVTCSNITPEQVRIYKTIHKRDMISGVSWTVA